MVERRTPKPDGRRGLETYLRRVVSLSKILYSPTGNTQEAVAPSRHDWNVVDWDVKPKCF